MVDQPHDLTAGYALDALDARERELYESHLATCEDCRQELASFWRVSGALARGAGGPPPPPELRVRILEQARAERQSVLPTNVMPLRRRVAVPAVATLAAVAAVAALALGLWSRSLSQELDRLRGSDAAVAVLSDPQARLLALRGASGALVVTPSGEAALVVENLERPPAGKVYEIWVMHDGIATPAGLFASAEARTALALDHTVPEGAIVGVTIEDAGGVDAPTGSPVFQSPPV